MNQHPKEKERIQAMHEEFAKDGFKLSMEKLLQKETSDNPQVIHKEGVFSKLLKKFNQNKG